MSIRTKIIQLLIDVNEKIIFYPALKKFYSENLKNKTINVIDVGSNKGQSIDFFLRIEKDCKIFGFEPNKKLFDKLLIKYKSNPSIKIYNYGISNKVGKLTFHENILDETSTFEQLNYNSSYLEKKAKILGVEKDKLIVDSYEVDVITLEMFLTNHPEMYFDVLKIDVEGHELQSIKGLFTSSKKNYPIKYLQLESHNDDMYLNQASDEIKKILNANNFFEVAKIKHGFGDFYEIIYENKSSK